ncbi:MAG: L,D-transpeptidase [Candidatus Cloacimonetes bacterium]|nr:L,D-transpeptidase [Candidatus Cloacimonadota bacterium]
MKFFILISIILLSIYPAFSQNPANNQQLLNYDKNISDLIENLNKDSIQIIIEKSKYKLSIQYYRKIIKSYPVVFGSNPIDDKLRQGDSCTPEGEFKIRDRYPHHSWSKFLWIDYPTDDSWSKHKEAKSQNKIPQNANIGGDLGIHGVPKGMDYLIDSKENWTLGCISLKNKDINEIYSITKIGTKVVIKH